MHERWLVIGETTVQAAIDKAGLTPEPSIERQFDVDA